MTRSVAMAGPALLLAILLAAAGCSRQTTGPTTADFQKQRARVVEKQKQMAALKLPERRPRAGQEAAAGRMGATSAGFAYDSLGRRDPFRSFINREAVVISCFCSSGNDSERASRTTHGIAILTTYAKS